MNKVIIHRRYVSLCVLFLENTNESVHKWLELFREFGDVAGYKNNFLKSQLHFCTPIQLKIYLKTIALMVGSNVSSIRASLLEMAHEDSTDQPLEESWTKNKK